MSKSKKDNILFRANDPRGKDVELRQEQLESHLKQRDDAHLTEPSVIKDTIEDPVFILQDSEHIKRQNYFKVSEKKAKKELYNKVVVHFHSESEPGDIVTAYTTAIVNPRSSEDVLWQKK